MVWPKNVSYFFILFFHLVISSEENSSSTIKNDSTVKMVNLNTQNRIFNAWVEVSIDGPFGTAARRILSAENAILIAGGIGVTPFASILQSLWYRSMSSKAAKVQTVDFVWVNRDCNAFEWFLEMLGELELQQLQLGDKRFIRVHLYMTSAKQEREIKLVDVIDMDDDNRLTGNKQALDKEKVKGFSMKLKPGRPSWNEVYNIELSFFEFSRS